MDRENRLTGKAGIKGEKFEDFLRNNKAFDIDFENKKLDDASPEALDLLHSMLAMNPDERVSAKEALEHSFFSGENLKRSQKELVKKEEAQENQK